MGQDTKIEWAHHSWSPWHGCSKVSAGCDFCYAATMSVRNPGVLGVWGPGGTRVVSKDWNKPVRWNREADLAGERRRVFPSICDPFEGPETMPVGLYATVRNARVRLFELMERTPHLDYLLLTKRPENIAQQIDEVYRECRCIPSRWPLPNCWLGVSVEDQAAADLRIPELLKVPAAVRFLSCEPLLGPVDLGRVGWDGRSFVDCLHGFRPFTDNALQPKVGWVIVGGESGPHARPMHPAWATSLRDQCAAAGVPFFMKQMDKKSPIPHDLFIREIPHANR